MPGTLLTTARTAGRSIYREKIIDVLLGVPVFFLLSQPLILNMHILGPAWFCALLPVRLRRTSGLFWACLGIMRLPNEQLRWKYGVIILLLMMIDTVWRRLIKDKQPVLHGICLASALPMAVLCLWMIHRMEAYHFIMTLLETILFFGCIQTYERSLRILENQRYNAWYVLSDHLWETACLFSTFLMILASWEFWYIAPGMILHISMISILCHRCGSGCGAIFTMITVLLLRLSGSCTEAYGFLCMILVIVSGYFRDMGRLAQSLASISAGIIYMILFMMQSRPYEIFIALLISQGIFYFIPENWYRSLMLKQETVVSHPEKTYQEQQIQRMETALQSLAEAISARPVQSRLSEKDMAFLCSDIAGRMCEKCERHMKCWGSEFHATYHVIGQVMQATQKKGKICRSDISGNFLENCPQGDEFVRLVNRYFEIYRLNLSWENRLEKNMHLASMQLQSVAKQLKNLRNEGIPDETIEKQFVQKLSGMGYRIFGIEIKIDKKQLRSIKLRVDQDQSHRARRQIEEMASEVAGCPMVIARCHICGRKQWEWELREQLRFQISVGVVSHGKETINGDCYIRDRLGYDQFLLALSDGMGTGGKAHKESELALALLEKMLAAGYKEEEAVSQLNLILLLHNREETYTTLDLGLIHLGTGDMTLVKAGGAVSVIRSQGKAELLKSEGLPIGILDDIEPAIYHRQLAGGDMIYMMSDGIMDQIKDIRKAEMLILKTIRDIPDSMGPQQAAECVYDTMIDAYGDQIEDDVTILAARLLKES